MPLPDADAVALRYLICCRESVWNLWISQGKILTRRPTERPAAAPFAAISVLLGFRRAAIRASMELSIELLAEGRESQSVRLQG